MAASLGLDATGIDSSPRAIAAGEAKARDRGLPARFEVGDALELHALGEQFDTVIDSGLFHVFSDDDRGRYVASLAAVLKPGGRYFLLCFSDQQPGESGPRRVAQDEIRRRSRPVGGSTASTRRQSTSRGLQPGRRRGSPHSRGPPIGIPDLRLTNRRGADLQHRRAGEPRRSGGAFWRDVRR